ncbi:hypothetical protein E2562_028392 [Oryza meyeriana var. granulata]|uniref:Uncharacterized protein n=1 Tax=Oryza meyeriana var. granulata TaxID=110450 RepID=A0A6G1E3H2_9ORYZ|nr:hypothetical protein E2562_028392 [Oryza meyeriana var. granulata]
MDKTSSLNASHGDIPKPGEELWRRRQLWRSLPAPHGVDRSPAAQAALTEARGGAGGAVWIKRSWGERAGAGEESSRRRGRPSVELAAQGRPMPGRAAPARPSLGAGEGCAGSGRRAGSAGSASTGSRGRQAASGQQ